MIGIENITSTIERILLSDGGCTLSVSKLIQAETKPLTADVIVFNSLTDCYERAYIELASLSGMNLLSLQFAVSVLPCPQIPSGPYGWYADLFDLDEQCSGHLINHMWSGSWLKITADGEFAILWDFLEDNLKYHLANESRRLINIPNNAEIVKKLRPLRHSRDLGLFEISNAELQNIKKAQNDGDSRWIDAGFSQRGAQNGE